jgi:hypothetical protein
MKGTVEQAVDRVVENLIIIKRGRAAARQEMVTLEAEKEARKEAQRARKVPPRP